jgi:hypothetical protein
MSRPAYQRPNIARVSAYDQAKVYFDPFSTATTNPKVPDGKCTLSAGQRLQSVKEWTMPATGSGVMEFIIHPGISNGITAFKTSIDSDSNLTEATDVQPYKTHGYFKYDADAASDPVFPAFLQPADQKIAKWRMVSQAVKFTLTNNSDENDGWWEAIRFTHSDSDQFYAMTNDALSGIANEGFTNLGDYVTAVNQKLFATDQNLGGANLVENPSYVTGKLRDIHKYLFQLKAHNTDHPFNNLNKRYSAPTKASATAEAAIGIDLQIQNEMMRAVIDKSFDIIYLRVHGRGGTTPTRILAHCVANQEIMYEAGSSMARFHSESSMIPNFDTLAGRATSTPGAIRAAKRLKRGHDMDTS